MDRNIIGCPMQKNSGSSLSARRAWIEMRKYHTVDRERASLSARRAWIEISPAGCWRDARRGRSPQGERG